MAKQRLETPIIIIKKSRAARQQPLQHGSFSTKLFVCIYRVHVIGHFARTLTGKLSRSSTSPQQCERRLH